MYNFLNPLFVPPQIPYSEKPPTLYSILNSIVNYDKPLDEKTKIINLAKEGRKTIFDFDYPLTDKLTKEEFETQILNRFLTRRIGFDTVVSFKIHLCSKLNEIMPKYNKMIDSMTTWDLFNDGEIVEKTGTNEFNEERKNETLSESQNRVENISENNTENVSDRRYSDTPQNQLENVENGTYLTDYNLDKNNAVSNDTSTSTAESSNNLNSKDNNKNETVYNEKIKRNISDKLYFYKEFQNEILPIYTLIYKDLDSLFYKICD